MKSPAVASQPAFFHHDRVNMHLRFGGGMTSERQRWTIQARNRTAAEIAPSKANWLAKQHTFGSRTR